jgi:dTDP-4-amino-4,6-dideoxygalactose transaminase
MSMHAIGRPMDIEDLRSIIRDFRLGLVEGATQLLGSTVDGRHEGALA